jgi:hypothetical protein
MLPGGIADKLGNRYEAKWLVSWLLRVLAGDAESLLFESADTSFHGFEFVVEHDGISHWHQTKLSSSGGNWTLTALYSAGVLQAFADRLATRDACCHFVSQDNAKEFYLLGSKARLSNGLQEFVDSLSQEQEIAFRKLLKYWAVDDSRACDWLKRCFSETISEPTLDWHIQSFGDLYFVNGGATAYASLRELAEENFNKLLTISGLREEIKQRGALLIKDWALDPTIQSRLKEKTEEYLGTYIPFGAGGETVERKEMSAIMAELLDPEGKELILLTGVAGSGKSGIVRAIIDNLRQDGIPHFAFRVDHYLQCSSREELGEQLLGRAEGPASTLKGTYPTDQSVLIIDQVDAVSEVSGRDGKVKEVIFRLITDAHNFGGMKVVVVCRTFDLQSDPRLKNLQDLKQTKEVEASLFDWKDDIEPLLVRNGVAVAHFSPQQRRLLELPVNLAIFLETGDKEPTFTSRSSLHEKLIEKKERSLARTLKPSWSVVQALTAMSEWMSKRQQLAAPASVLDQFPGAVDILCSEGLIISSKGRLNFFHESFFDHLYARSFLFKDQTILQMLLQTEQHLFRRTQVRQILDALRQNDFDRYIIELSNLIFHAEVRFHIKLAICQWLNSVSDPIEEEYSVVARLDGTNGASEKLFRQTIFSGDQWFDILDAKNWIASQLEAEDERREVVFWWLSTIAAERPTQIDRLLRNWWGNDPERADRLITWFGFVNRAASDSTMLQFCWDVVRSHPPELFKDDGRDRVGMLLDHLDQRETRLGGEILEALFDAWLVLNPAELPFERDNSLISHHSLDELPRKVPMIFLAGTTKAFLSSVEQVIQEGKSGPQWYHFQHRSVSGHRSGFDQFISSYVEALKRVATSDASVARAFLSRLPPGRHTSFMHVHLELIAAHPELFAHELPELAGDDLVFEAGWYGADWRSFADACRAAFPQLSPERRSLVENRILNRNVELEHARDLLRDIAESGEELPFWTRRRAVRDLNNNGFEKWCESGGAKLVHGSGGMAPSRAA